MIETNEATKAAHGLIVALKKVGELGLRASDAFTALLEDMPKDAHLIEGVIRVMDTLIEIENEEFEFANTTSDDD